jgi:hypothetical protein
MLEVIELLGRIIEGIFGLRFLMSPNYRRRTRERWQTAKPGAILLECAGAVLGIVLLGLIGFLALRIAH